MIHIVTIRADYNCVPREKFPGPAVSLYSCLGLGISSLLEALLKRIVLQNKLKAISDR